MYRAPSRTVTLLFFSLALLVLPVAATAQTGPELEMTVFPAEPTTADGTVDITLRHPACTLQPSSLVVSPDGTITVGSGRCEKSLKGVPSFAVGPLAAGNYTVVLVDHAGQRSELGGFTVVEGGPPQQLGAGLSVRAIPGRAAFEVTLLDVPGLGGCASRVIVADQVWYEGPVVRVLLSEVPLEVTCAGLPAPADVTVALASQPLVGFYSVALMYAEDGGLPYRPLGAAHIAVAPDCQSSFGEALCLGDGRFRVGARWTSRNATGPARPVPLTADSGAFWFFRPDNLELTVKVLDACATFGRYWVFISGLTNQGVDIEVSDTAAGERRFYSNDLGRGFEAIRDTNAFATCDAAP